MRCMKCPKKSEINLRHMGRLCSSHFLELIEKRARKRLRTKKLIKKNDRILFINNESKEHYVGEFLLKSIIKDLPVKIEVKKSKTIALNNNITKKYSKIIVPWSLDDEAEEFLNSLFNRKKPKSFSKKSVKLLKNLSEEEIDAFAKIKRFKYKKKPKSKIKKMLDSLEQKYPGYKFSLLNSIAQLK